MNVLHNLMSFDSTKTNFSAKLPISWTPILSDQQQQSKHPQHIHSESVNLSKSWKFINMMGTSGAQMKSSSRGAGGVTSSTSSYTSSGIEDLNVEIYLNKPVQIGCIQLKLKFSRELTNGTTPYELRLFRPKKSNEMSMIMSTAASKSNDLK